MHVVAVSESAAYFKMACQSRGVFCRIANCNRGQICMPPTNEVESRGVFCRIANCNRTDLCSSPRSRPRALFSTFRDNLPRSNSPSLLFKRLLKHDLLHFEGLFTLFPPCPA